MTIHALAEPGVHPCRHWPAMFASLLALAAMACGGGDDESDAPTGPGPTPTSVSLKVITATAGTNLDVDGYTISVDGGQAQSIGINASKTLSLNSTGTHSVLLAGLAANCTVNGSNPRTANVQSGAPAEVSFAITCAASLAVIQITTATTGSLVDPDGFTYSIDGGAPQAIGHNESKSVNVGTTGNHSVQLGSLPVNCSVSGGNTKTVNVAAGSPATASFSVVCINLPAPVNGKIAFESDRSGNYEVYVMNADGTDVVKLTDHPALDFEPAWSPDGSKIAFVSRRTGSDEIYVMNADGSGLTKLTSTTGTDRAPAWSPDGSKIAWESSRDGNDEIYVMNADGSAETNLTKHFADDSHPAWSPDGSKIAFHSDRDANKGYEVYVMKPDGTNVVNLTNNAADFDARPAWSPDGSKLAFVSSRDGNLEIYMMNANGSGQTRLTSHPELDSYPEWSPDGSSIAFRSDRTGNIEVYVMLANGSGPVNRTNNQATDCHPSWKASGGSSIMGLMALEASPAKVVGPVRALNAQLAAETACLGNQE